MALFPEEEALACHEVPPPGTREVWPVKPRFTHRDFPMPYSPGGAAACLASVHTGRGNLVAVVSNGTAVLGNIGPLTGKPIMEGTSLLFKVLADVNAYETRPHRSRHDHRSRQGPRMGDAAKFGRKQKKDTLERMS